MKKIKWQIKLAFGLVVLSAFLYWVTYMVFGDPHHMFLFLLEDLAFIPIEVLVVSLLIDKVIEKREKTHMLQKLNMVIGLFYTEVGTTVLKGCIKYDENIDTIENEMVIKKDWENKDFDKALKLLKKYKYSNNINSSDLERVKEFLISKRNFLMRLIENPNLLEHDTFTELLNAVFHLEEELSSRDLSNLSEDDLEHLQNNIVRVYKYIVYDWIQYMRHVQKEYPYLFTTALRNNPFEEVKEGK